MKKIALSISASLIFCTLLSAQSNVSNTMSVGFNLNQYQNDFGIGLTVTSPYFFKGAVAVRGGVNLQYLQHIPQGQEEADWSPYTNVRLGVASAGAVICESIRIYGEGGAVLILPNDVFSDTNATLGAYGVFGFEFFMEGGSSSFFFEAGGLGVDDTVAEKSVGSPIYSNGFLLSTGMRVYLW